MGQIAQQSPSLATILRPNLPRPKILRSLLSLAHIKDDQGVYRIADIDPVTVTQNAFVPFVKLEKACMLDTECGRRGCTKESEARCSVCHTVVYCGPECQKR